LGVTIRACRYVDIPRSHGFNHLLSATTRFVSPQIEYAGRG
jgi:hypothetical protein